MNELSYLGSLAARHAWARREYAALHADIVEARLAARARDAERAARLRRWLVGGVPERIRAPRRPAARMEPGCKLAAARSAGFARPAGGVR